MSHSINIIKNKFDHTVFLKEKVHIFQNIIFRNDQYLNGNTKTLQKLNPFIYDMYLLEQYSCLRLKLMLCVT